MAMSPLLDEAERDEVVAEINVTPLTDVFLVLLIIFMVTSTALMQAGLNVNLPRSHTATSQTRGVMITAAADGSLYVNDRATTLAKLGEALRSAFTEGSERIVTIRGDERVILRTLVQIMDISRRAGAMKIGVATRYPERR
ncbi:MAG: ExbD/TolR family protein [Candidatus Methylomirabilia bacterium]